MKFIKYYLCFVYHISTDSPIDYIHFCLLKRGRTYYKIVECLDLVESAFHTPLKKLLHATNTQTGTRAVINLIGRIVTRKHIIVFQSSFSSLVLEMLLLLIVSQNFILHSNMCSDEMMCNVTHPDKIEMGCDTIISPRISNKLTSMGKNTLNKIITRSQ